MLNCSLPAKVRVCTAVLNLKAHVVCPSVSHATAVLCIGHATVVLCIIVWRCPVPGRTSFELLKATLIRLLEARSRSGRYLHTSAFVSRHKNSREQQSAVTSLARTMADDLRVLTDSAMVSVHLTCTSISNAGPPRLFAEPMTGELP